MKITITDCDHKNIDIEKNIFKNAGLEVSLMQAKTEDEVIEKCKGSDILIVQYAKITEKVMNAIPELKLIVRYGVGVDSLDIPAATRNNIQIANVPDYGMNEVADQAMSMILVLLRKILEMNQYTKTKKWDYTKAIPIRRFSEQTIGIVGLGRIGKCLAKRAQAFGFNIIGYDPNANVNLEGFEFIQKVGFEELLKKSDAISIHCPSDGNINLFGKNEFDIMKSSSIIVNTARGGIINEADLYNALKNKDIGGAALDCMAKEPMNPDSEIFKFENFIVSPHIGWYSEEAAQELKRKVAEEAVRFIKGEKVHYPINNLT